MTDGAPDKAVWFIRGVPVEFRERVNAAARVRRQTVGELVVELLGASLAKLESAPVEVSTGERLSALEARVAALEGRKKPIERPVRGPAGDGAGEPVERAVRRPERLIGNDPNNFIVWQGDRKLLTETGELEVLRLCAAGESKRAVGRALGVSDRTVSAVLERRKGS